MKSFYLHLLGALLSFQIGMAQIGLGGQPHPSAALDVNSPANNKAFYPPRLTTAQRRAIQNPQPGAMVYDVEKGRLYLHDGQNWYPIRLSTLETLPLIDRFPQDGINRPQEYFGSSVAISGDYAIVGAYGRDVGLVSDQGRAYIFARTKNGWIQQAILTASDGAAYDYFGSSVAISGDYAVVGAYYKSIPRENTNPVTYKTSQGAAYLFVRSGDTWVQQAKLTSNDGDAEDHFGSSVSINGDIVLIGATGKNSNQGKLYVFTKSGSTWTEQSQLAAIDGTSGDLFGSSVSFNGQNAVVGAPGKDVVTNDDRGAVYIYSYLNSTWLLQTKIDGPPSRYLFGVTTAVSNKYVAVGTSATSISTACGVYIYELNPFNSTWSQVNEFFYTTPGSSFIPYATVSLSEKYFLVGVSGTPIGANINQGSIYAYRNFGLGWVFFRQINDESPAYTRNGEGVSISNDGTFIIGGPGYNYNIGKVAFGIFE